MREKKPMTRLVRQRRSGQVTIPADFRKRLGIEGDGLLQVTLMSGELRIGPVHLTDQAKGSPWLKELYERFAPVREQAAKYSEEEINSDIDRAIADVRRSVA